MRSRRRVVIAIVPSLVLNVLVHSGHAWEEGAHTLITSDAVRMLPDPLRAKLQGELASVWTAGVIESAEGYDRLYLGALRGTAPDGAGADAALERFARRAEGMLTAGESLRDVVFVLGKAARIIQDLNVPLHTVWGETVEEHGAYERRAYFHDWPDRGQGYRGFHLVESYECFAFETARRSYGLVSFALWHTPPRRVIKETWDHAVNDTINLWLSIFYRSLGAEKSRDLYAIPSPLEEIGHASSCQRPTTPAR